MYGVYEMGSLYFQIASLFYLGLITIIYCTKKKRNTLENKIYLGLLIVTFVTLFLDMASVYLAIVNPTHFFANPLCKLYLVGILGWVFLFTYYIFVISSKKNRSDEAENSEKVRKIYFKKAFYILLAIYLISSLIILTIPLNIYSDGNLMYTYGPSAMFSYGITGICVVFWLVIMLSNYKEIKDKKYLPAFAFIVLATVSVIIQATFPEILLVTSAAAFITVLTYFTIENPDLKLINELNFAREQAEKANNAKSEFLSSMSHEIRTPLNAIVGFSQALAEEEISNEAKEEVNDIIMASENLLEIVNGILDISKIEANKLEIVNTEYEPAKILEELVALSKARLGEKPIEFRTNFDPLLPKTLFGDYMRIKQITLNLLTNAIKYTKTGYIEFRVSCIQKENVCRLIISVEDSGIGIQKEKIDKLFTKFERFDIEKNITIEGTGLGLAITKKLVELMNGKIVVQSIYGQGSKFTVALDQQIVLTPTVSISEVPPKEDPIDLSLLVNKKVLIVDDNKINLKVASRLLKDYNIKTEEVDSGFECINRILQKEEYDLILLDDMMPKMSGVETLKKLKEISDFHTPTIALTANAISGMKEKYLKEGFDDYLSKPIDRKELNRVIRKFLNTK